MEIELWGARVYERYRDRRYILFFSRINYNDATVIKYYWLN